MLGFESMISSAFHLEPPLNHSLNLLYLSQKVKKPLRSPRIYPGDLCLRCNELYSCGPSLRGSVLCDRGNLLSSCEKEDCHGTHDGKHRQGRQIAS